MVAMPNPTKTAPPTAILASVKPAFGRFADINCTFYISEFMI
jgi:hypothetical protein